jgi:hypothetical protein
MAGGRSVEAIPEEVIAAEALTPLDRVDHSPRDRRSLRAVRAARRHPRSCDAQGLELLDRADDRGLHAERSAEGGGFGFVDALATALGAAAGRERPRRPGLAWFRGFGLG